VQEVPKESIASWLSGAPPAAETDGAQVYRLGRVFLVLGVGATLCFVAIGVGSVVAAWWNIDGSFSRPGEMATIFGILWSGFALLGGYMILGYFRERLFVDDVGVLHQRCFTRRWLKFGDVTQAQWQSGSDVPSLSGPNLILRDPATKIVVRLNQWGNVDERRELIQHFRQSIDPRAQQDWETFESRILVDPSGLIAWRGEAWVGMMFFIFAGGSLVGWLVDWTRRGNLRVAGFEILIGAALIAHALRRKNRAVRTIAGD
jgi:hypothetical protein